MNPANYSDRAAVLQRQMNTPISCKACGSVWFQEGKFQQYSGTVYGFKPGGDIQPLSSTEQNIRVCVCGEPYMPNLGGSHGGRQTQKEINSFMDSLQLASSTRRQIREASEKLTAPASGPEVASEPAAVDVEDLTKKLGSEFILRSESEKSVKALQKEIDSLKKTVTDLVKALGEDTKK